MANYIAHPEAKLRHLARSDRRHGSSSIGIDKNGSHNKKDLEAEIVVKEGMKTTLRNKEAVEGPGNVRSHKTADSNGVHQREGRSGFQTSKN